MIRHDDIMGASEIYISASRGKIRKVRLDGVEFDRWHSSAFVAEAGIADFGVFPPSPPGPYGYSFEVRTENDGAVGDYEMILTDVEIKNQAWPDRTEITGKVKDARLVGVVDMHCKYCGGDRG